MITDANEAGTFDARTRDADGVADFTLLINGDATTASASAWLR